VRLTLGHQGGWVVDPRELVARLGVDTEDLKRLEPYGYVDARIKDGGEDACLTRVTVHLLNSGWRGIFDQGTR
jgi:hypothetical protein